MSDRTIQITKFDLERLSKLLSDAQHSDHRRSSYLLDLETELERAKVVHSEAVSNEVVTMNSQVRLIDLDTNEEIVCTLVFPEDANIGKGRISVLAPVGTAMLGYRVGDSFEWQVPAGKRRLLVKKILYQPEAAGDYHL